jgi:hypothetical protein
MASSNPFFEHTILYSPCEYATRYWLGLHFIAAQRAAGQSNRSHRDGDGRKEFHGQGVLPVYEHGQDDWRQV